MNLLQTINKLVTEGDDFSNRIPYDDFTKIKKLIKKGADDPEHDWSSALDLVHRAFQVSNIEVPDPMIEDAWEQFEECIELAVTSLQKATDKGIRDDSWKTLAYKVDQMSSGKIF